MKTDGAHWIRRSAAFTFGCSAILLAGCDGPCGDRIYCYPELGDAGSKANDIAMFLAVQRADETVGGNVILGQAGPIGKKAGVLVDVRANHISRRLPEVNGITMRTGATTATDFQASNQSATAVTATVATALWRGVASGPTHIGELDLTGSLSYLQGFQDNSLHISSNSSIATGIGFRIGLVEETRTLPGITYAVSLRFVPAFDFSSNTIPVLGGGTMTIGGDSIDVRATSWRFAASKQFGAIGATAGMGGDSYSGSGSVSAALSGSSLGAMSGSQYVSAFPNRRNLFIGGSYTMRGVSLVGEFGHLSQSGAYPTYFTNTVRGQSADMSRNYLSLGVRLGGVR